MERYPMTYDANLDYGFLLNNWLEDGETVSTCVWTVPHGLVKGDEIKTTTVVGVWLTNNGSEADYVVKATFTTTAGRTDSRSFGIRVVPNRGG